jgi:uncharacterized protein YdeI (YjbR/CyaY-like superfamily)
LDVDLDDLRVDILTALASSSKRLTRTVKVTYFKSASEFRTWLEREHSKAKEVWVGFYKKQSGLVGITYAEALDEALCFGWIDGIRKRVDEVSYTNRFTPRQPRSIWSLVNTRRVEQLIEFGRMTDAGLKAFALRDPKRTGIYTFERTATFDAAAEKQLKSDKRAWQFFQAQPPGYRRLTTGWVMSAKRLETRARRLQQLIAASAKHLRVGAITAKKD